MSKWEIMAQNMGVEYIPWIPPNHGSPERSQFDYEEFSLFEKQLEAEVAELRAVVGTEPYTASQKPEKTPEPMSEREQRMANAAAFMQNLELSLPEAS